MEKKVKAFFKKNPQANIKSKVLAKRLNMQSAEDYASLKVVLHLLTSENYLSRVGKRYKLNFINTEKITGQVQISETGGFGFVIPSNKKISDIFISERNLGTAFHGDLVEVLILAKKKGKSLEGQITKIIERKKKEIVGTLRKTKSFYFVEPDERTVHRDIYISKEMLAGAKSGSKVVVHDIEWNNNQLNPEGKIKEVLGKTGSYDTEITALARELNLSYQFPVKVLEEAEKISEKIPDSEINKRLDLRDKLIFTIDPDDAKDFDDAVSVEYLDNGNFEIGVHIADVSHFVKQGTMIYDEAYKRGTSVYFVGKVLPMLPEKLSNTICSLVPNRDRLTFSVIMEITKSGKVISSRFNKTVINSKRRFTYKEVQKILDDRNGDCYNELSLLNKMAKTFKQIRTRKGSINFITPEVEFELNEKGEPVNISIKQILESHNLIEEFMLLANRIIAAEINTPANKNRIPFVYRVHDKPDEEKLKEFAVFVKSLGYSFDQKSLNQSIQMQHLLEKVKDTQEEALINEIAIRSMSKAVYTPDNIGHYGLAFKHYTHFTSPIRRFPDLIVHEIVHKNSQSDKPATYTHEELIEICERASNQERSAVQAERLSVKLKQMEFLRNHIGDEFEGVISGITNFGIFVELSGILAEGLIKLRDMDDDYYIYDEKKYSLRGERLGKTYRLGDKVWVRVVRIDEMKRGIDFLLLNN